MTDIPKVGYLCTGKTPLELACSVNCSRKLMRLFSENGFSTGACYTEIVDICKPEIISRTSKTLEHLTVCCDLVITIGCEGFGKGDVIPDITELLCEKKVLYFSGLLCGAARVDTLPDTRYSSNTSYDVEDDKFGFSYYSRNQADKIFVRPSRATAGIHSDALILNLSNELHPCLALIDYILPAINFTIYNLSGKSAASNAEFEQKLNFASFFNKL